MYRLSNTNGLQVLKDDAVQINFPSYEALYDWIMLNGRLINESDIDKFYIWQLESAHG